MIFGDESFDNLGSAIQKANSSLKNYITGLDVAKLKTIGLKAATVAFEAALTLGVTFAISKLLEAFNKFAHAEELAVEQEKKVRQETVESIRAYNEEVKESQDLSASYVELVSTTSDLTTEKEKLLDIQEKINKGITDQTDKVDLLNKSLSENIELTAQQRLEEAKRIISENQATYEGIVVGEQASYSAMQTYGDKDVIKAISEIELATGKRVSGTLAEQSKQLGEILESYHSINGYNKQYYNDLEKGKQAIDAQLADWAEIKTTVEAAQKTVNELSISPEMQKSFNGLVDSAKELYNQLNGADNASQEFLISEKLKEVKSEIYELIGSNSELTQIADSLFASFDKGMESVLGDVGNLKEAWLNTLDDMQKGSLKNISTMVSALQDLSEGKGIASNTFWQLVEFDTEGLLNGAKLVGDRFVITQENMIKLKDQYVKKQIEEIAKRQAEVMLNKEQYEQDVKRYELQVATMRLSKENITNPQEYQRVVSLLETAKSGAKAFGDEWERNNWLIEYLNQTLGNTIDLQKQLEAQQKELNKQLTALNKELDNYQKAYEAKIDGIVKGLEAELHTLENEKEVLEDELDVLEKREDVLKETLDNYEKVNSYVQKIIDKEIEGLEEQRDAIKNTYDERINALKSENEEREDALEYAQKLANLENAKNNKRRVYDEARGWRYESVKEDVVKAESDLKTFETNQQVKSLEKERDEEIKAWDALIKQKEDYKKQWAEWLEEIQLEESEALAQEILGADWREKIAERDIELIDTFAGQYRKHNADLRNLTETEIKLKKASIDAKNAEIDAKKKQITAWKDYKTELTTAVVEIKQANEDYMEQIGTIELTETSSLERRDQEFEKFKNNVSNYIEQIGQKQSMIDSVTESLDKISGGDYKLSFEVEGYDRLTEVETTLQRIVDKMKGVQILNAAEIAQMMDEVGIGDVAYGEKMAAFLRKLMGYSSGGVADYTGLAMLHGRKNAPETIFNANDSAKLYEMVHNTPSIMADMLTQANKLAGFKLSSNENTNNNSVSIGAINVYANNPTELTQGLDKTLDRYFRTKLTQSYTSRQ